MKWQEGYARWMLKPKWPRKLNSKLEPYVLNWWWSVGTGLLLSGILVIPLLPIENPMKGSPFENLAEQWQALAFYGMKIALCLVAGLILLFHILAGLIIEERKGYKMIIERLEKDASNKTN